MIEITDDQRRQLESGKAVDVTDPQTAERYVVMKKEVYDRQRTAYDAADWTDDELRIQLARSARDNGWDDPGMDAYDRYDEELRQQCQ
jgi:hypothetical protein